jgi:hypothetical protein
MNSHPLQNVVLAELGDKVPAAVAESVAGAREDLAVYRELRPGWVADHSERGLANWIHDRVWAHLMQRLDGDTDVVALDREPIRVFRVGLKYLIRVKRHGVDDKISTYPTQTALQFYMQGAQPLFPDMEEIRLAAGYLWNAATRSIGEAVISMRDGLDNVVWRAIIGFEPGEGVVGIRPISPEPPLPVIDPPGEAEQTDQGEA